MLYIVIGFVTPYTSLMGIIRLILATTVLLWHCPVGVVSRILHPALAVQCFYAISGFLIQMVLWSSDTTAPGWKGRFYLSRWLRIYPLYALFLMLTLALVSSGSFFDLVHKHELWASAVWLLNNFLILGQDVLRFLYFNYNTGQFLALPSTQEARTAVQAVSGQMTMMGQSWTLAIEFYFYLLAPFLLLSRSTLLAGLICLTTAIRVYLGYQGHYLSEWVYGFFPSELAIFLAGSLAYRAYRSFFGSGRLARLIGERTLLLICSLVVAALCWVYMTVDLNFAGGSSQWGAPPLGVAPGYWLILLMTIMSLPCAFYFSTRLKWDRFIGELSYPIYISHFVILQLLSARLQPSNDGQRYVVAAVLITSLLVSAAAIQWIEMPLDRLRHRIFSRKKAPVV